MSNTMTELLEERGYKKTLPSFARIEYPLNEGKEAFWWC